MSRAACAVWIFTKCAARTPAHGAGTLHPTSRSFCRAAALGWGYCTPGRRGLRQLRAALKASLEALQPNLELLAQWGLPLSLAENFQARLSRLNLDLPCPVATCMSGFQVRNVFVTGGKLIFLDPEDLAEGHTLQNVASFLVSLELLFWGTPWFLLPLPLRNQMREAFLEGYGANAPFDTRALWLWEIKQFVVYWKCAYRVLANKGYPRPVSFLVRKIYIDRFYSKAVMNRLEALVGQLPHQYE